MNQKISTLVLSIALLSSVLFAPAPSEAQGNERVWDQGSVWEITYVETKPGKFNAYIKDLSQVWRKFMDAQKEAGDVLSYKMLTVDSPRDGEPNLMLLVEYKNMAVFDKGVAEFEEMAKEIMGSLENMDAANTDREALRIIRSTVRTREISFME